MFSIMVARALHLVSSSFRVVLSVLDKSETLLRFENTLQNKKHNSDNISQNFISRK